MSKKTPKYIIEELQGENAQFVEFKKVTLSLKQKELIDLISRNKIVVATGPAGTAKTFCASYAALKLFASDFCEKIIITKPTEIVGSSALGFLPGSLDEKLAVYTDSFTDVFSDIIERDSLKMMVENKEIEYKPVQFVRGKTFKNTVVIIDEFQSFDIKELMAIVTRFGKPNCKMIFVGDINQNDIDKRYLAVNQFKEILDGIKDCATFEFERKDIVRDEILIQITDRYDQLKEQGKLALNKKNT